MTCCSDNDDSMSRKTDVASMSKRCKLSCMETQKGKEAQQPLELFNGFYFVFLNLKKAYLFHLVLASKKEEQKPCNCCTVQVGTQARETAVAQCTQFHSLRILQMCLHQAQLDTSLAVLQEKDPFPADLLLCRASRKQSSKS